MKKTTIKVKKLSESFFLTTDGDKKKQYGILVKVFECENGGKEISLSTPVTDSKEFVFQYSDPEVLQKMGELLIRASELGKRKIV